MRILVAGNCQTQALAQLFRAMLLDAKVNWVNIAEKDMADIDPAAYDHLVLQVHPRLRSHVQRLAGNPKLLVIPHIGFNGYHPDIVGLDSKSGKSRRLIASNIALCSIQMKLSRDECLSLYCEEFVSLLNYRHMFELARQHLVSTLETHGFNGSFLFEKWHMQGPFMLNIGHPHLFVMHDMAKEIVRKAGLSAGIHNPLLQVDNPGRRGTIFPTYNHTRGDNRLLSPGARYKIAQGASYDLPGFVAYCYENLEGHLKEFVLPDSARQDDFAKALASYRSESKNAKSQRINPYANLPATSFWESAVAAVPEVSAMSPVCQAEAVISKTCKVATAGSCFAQHISRTLAAHGFNYHVAETPPPGMDAVQAEEKRYGVFSSRYGNIYTARQLLQLIQAATATFSPLDKAWMSKDGRWLDPFRPNVGDEFDTVEEVIQARAAHLGIVRKMFTELDVFVFTLGLTEAWIHTGDGSVFPVAPGVVSQHRSYRNYEFRNFDHDEILADMVEFLGYLFELNPRARVVLTVSPVPLIATYEPEHVLCANTYSKSVLRSVARKLATAFQAVRYFPSYEIITGAYGKSAYYEADLRNVTAAGVDHVMSVFVNSMTGDKVAAQASAARTSTADAALLKEMADNAEVVCDENLIVNNESRHS